MLKLGRDFVLLIDGGAGYARVEAQRSTSVSITSDVVDSTTKGEDWREILRNAGINAAQINVSGVSVDAPALQLITAKKMQRQHIQCRVDDSVGEFLAGMFKVVSVAFSGEFNGEETYDIALQSTGLFGYPIAGDAWQWDSGAFVQWDSGALVELAA